jgi:cytochrome b
MARRKENGPGTSDGPPTIRVWDLPTRLFHWLLVVCVALSYVSGRTGGNAMRYHLWSGGAILGLILFRLAWGLVGGRHARFADFVRGPAAAARYARDLWRRQAPRHPGHNPLGGWSILAMLASLLLQAVTGLFASDDILTEGPLMPLVSKAASDFLTRLHRLNQQVVVALVALHLAAIMFYWLRGENLVTPMITGRKEWYGTAPAPEGDRLGRAAWIAGSVALAVYFLVR